ncbi:hypothetical protein [Aeromicrobium sp. 179-A 4D2 NHS]|uniref:hypothetical protein n=1 Tax=Aeromicrobium sp. 179-A 4D2 NHS TaxID=3142375 RepID=UPI0039A162B0
MTDQPRAMNGTWTEERRGEPIRPDLSFMGSHAPEDFPAMFPITDRRVIYGVLLAHLEDHDDNMNRWAESHWEAAEDIHETLTNDVTLQGNLTQTQGAALRDIIGYRIHKIGSCSPTMEQWDAAEEMLNALREDYRR